MSLNAPLEGRARAGVPLRLRSGIVLAVASVAGLMMLIWPLLVQAEDGTRVQPPFLFLALMPVVLVVVLAELSEGGMDARALAILGVLIAVNAVLRGLSAGFAGLELVFFLLILAGRVFGPAFGFVLGTLSMFAGALLTAGVGPWLPYQMLVAGWVGLGAGLLPRRLVGGRALTGRWEIALLAVYAVLAAYLYGLLLNLQGWPYLLGIGVPGVDGQGLMFVAGDPLIDNLGRFAIYTLVTSTTSWDTGRAITSCLAVVLLGPSVLVTLRRAARRARIVRG